VAELVLTQEVDAPPDRVFEVLTDWAVHDRWMLLTRAEGDHAAGGEIRAFTGIGRLGFLDTMVITVWEPPRRAVVRHVGKVVRGSGAFEVEDLGAGRSRVVWSEWVLLPLGAVGQLLWPVARIPLRVLLQVSLRRLARYVVTQP
jgi:carbon monoxide dehydrogenase subunit G